jgi:hypothetical protein
VNGFSGQIVDGIDIVPEMGDVSSTPTPVVTNTPTLTIANTPTYTMTGINTSTTTSTPIISTGTYTFTPTPIATFTPTRTPTSTATRISSITALPTSVVITIGETNVLNTDDSGNGNLLVAQQAVLSQSATIQNLSFYVATTGGQLRLGIYSDNGGNPGTLLAQTAAFTPVVTGWSTQNVQTPVLLPAGMYWLTYLPQSNTMHYRIAFTGSARGASSTFGTMPAAYPGAAMTGTFHWSFYATFSR